MAATTLAGTPLVLNDADLELVARVAERLLAGRPLHRAGSLSHRRRVGIGLEFFDYRSYVAGDDLRHIDWRASARSRRLQLRRYHEEAASQWIVCLDASASMQVGDAAKWRLGAEIAAAFAYVLLALGSRVGLLVFSDGIEGSSRPGRGQRHYASVLETIAAAPAATGGRQSQLGACVAAVPRDTALVVVSDFLRPDAMQPDLALLACLAGGLHAVRIAARGDFALLPPGPARLHDAETGQEQDVAGDEASLAAEAAWARHTSAWESACERLAIASSTAFTEANDWKSALIAHLLGVVGRRRA